jgi:hypothetical protein
MSYHYPHPKISQERKFAAMRMYHQATCIIFKGDIVACQFNLSDGEIGNAKPTR